MIVNYTSELITVGLSWTVLFCGRVLHIGAKNAYTVLMFLAIGMALGEYAVSAECASGGTFNSVYSSVSWESEIRQEQYMLQCVCAESEGYGVNTGQCYANMFEQPDQGCGATVKTAEDGQPFLYSVCGPPGEDQPLWTDTVYDHGESMLNGVQVKSLGDLHVIREEDISAKAMLHLSPLGPWHQPTGCTLEEIARLMNVSTHPRTTPNKSNTAKPTGSSATTPGVDSTIYTDPVVLKAMVLLLRVIQKKKLV